MKTNQILIGVGVVAIGLYLYNKNKKEKSVETSSTGGESPLPPDKMPTPIPDLPKEEKGTTSVYFCKDGTRQVYTIKPNVKMLPPCSNNGGIDEAKTKKNEGGGVQKMSCVGAECKDFKCPEGYFAQGGRGIVMSMTCIKNCPQGQRFVSGGYAGGRGGMCIDINSKYLPSQVHRVGLK